VQDDKATKLQRWEEISLIYTPFAQLVSFFGSSFTIGHFQVAINYEINILHFRTLS